MTPYRRPRPRRADPEGDLQRELVGELRLAGVDFCHVPNSTGRGGAKRQGQLKSLGVTPGVSDILIFDPPRIVVPIGAMPWCGACLELKAIDRVVPVLPWEDKRASLEQREFLRRRALQRWVVAVCGPGEARAQLVAWGYLA
jgi:hypothetical protein